MEFSKFSYNCFFIGFYSFFYVCFPFFKFLLILIINFYVYFFVMIFIYSEAFKSFLFPEKCYFAFKLRLQNPLVNFLLLNSSLTCRDKNRHLAAKLARQARTARYINTTFKTIKISIQYTFKWQA